jgi:hypothetical protein
MNAFLNTLRRLFRPAARRSARRGVQLRLDALEDRLVPASLDDLSNLASQLGQRVDAILQSGLPRKTEVAQFKAVFIQAQQQLEQMQFTSSGDPTEDATDEPLFDSTQQSMLASIAQALASFGNAGSNGKGSGSRHTTLHANEPLGNALLRLEETLRVEGELSGASAQSGAGANFNQGSWFWQRDNWLRAVEHAHSPGTFGRLLLQLEGSIDRIAFDAAWPALEASWQASVLKAHSLSAATALLRQLESHLRLPTFGGGWMPYHDLPGILENGTTIPTPIPDQSQSASASAPPPAAPTQWFALYYKPVYFYQPYWSLYQASTDESALEQQAGKLGSEGYYTKILGPDSSNDFPGTMT